MSVFVLWFTIQLVNSNPLKNNVKKSIESATNASISNNLNISLTDKTNEILRELKSNLTANLSTEQNLLIKKDSNESLNSLNKTSTPVDQLKNSIKNETLSSETATSNISFKNESLKTNNTTSSVLSKDVVTISDKILLKDSNATIKTTVKTEAVTASTTTAIISSTSTTTVSSTSTTTVSSTSTTITLTKTQADDYEAEEDIKSNKKEMPNENQIAKENPLVDEDLTVKEVKVPLEPANPQYQADDSIKEDQPKIEKPSEWKKKIS